MNKSSVKGFLGELVVRQKLEEAGFDYIESLGNQTGYDLSMGQDRRVRIDVKASLLKDEFKWGCEHWGWALIHSNKKKPVSATHFICLGFDNNLNASIFIIIPAEMATKFPEGIRQFSKVSHSVCLFPGTKRPLRKLSHKEALYINHCEKLLKDKSIKVIRGKGSFRKIFS